MNIAETKEEVNALTTDELILFLKARIRNLPDAILQSLKDNLIDGEGFLMLTKSHWTDLGIPLGVSVKFLNLTEKINANTESNLVFNYPMLPLPPAPAQQQQQQPPSQQQQQSQLHTNNPSMHRFDYGSSQFSEPVFQEPMFKKAKLEPNSGYSPYGSPSRTTTPLDSLYHLTDLPLNETDTNFMFGDQQTFQEPSSQQWKEPFSGTQLIQRRIPVPAETLRKWEEERGTKESYEGLKVLLRTLRVPKDGNMCPFENCDFEKNSKNELMRHINSSHIQYQIPCPFCEGHFLYESSLNRHNRDRHAQHRNDGIPVYKTKLMAVGYERVGKTSLLDCLFPLSGLVMSWTSTKREQKTKFFFQLQGRYLRKFSSDRRELLEESILGEGLWNMTSSERSPPFSIKLSHTQPPTTTIELFFESYPDLTAWVERIKRVVKPDVTHGVDISKHDVDTESTRPKKLELSVWDFAGQHDYYNNHHYFLQSRTVFLVGWKLSQGPGGMKGLEFWFKSLAAHLPPNPNDDNGKPLFSIIVVGTHLDDPSVIRGEKTQRSSVVQKLATDCGLSCPIQVMEVSNMTLENISLLQETVIKTALSHSYMGEKIPVSYQGVQAAITNLRQKKEVPLMDVQEILHFCRQSQLEIDLESVKQALSLLSAWGECVYFDEPEELSSIVVLDPGFLTKQVLAQLFSLDKNLQAKRENGIIHHKDLEFFWAEFRHQNFNQLAPTLMSLMETFEVCFRLYEDSDNHDSKPTSFFEQKSIIPALLPEESPENFSRHWPSDPPFNRKIQVERFLKFNIVPKELISRLLVRLHKHIQNHQIWRYGVLIMKEETQALIQVDIPFNKLVVYLRGSNRQECSKLMDYIIKEVQITTSNYPGVLWKQAIRSPHFPDALIALEEEISKDAARPEDARKLVCPETRLPIKAEDLLMSAGLLDGTLPQKSREKAVKWWNFGLAQEMGEERESFETRDVLQDGIVHDQELSEKLNLLFTSLGGDPHRITKAVAIDNVVLRNNFDGYRETLTQKHKDSASLFKKDDWRLKDNWKLRRQFLLHLNEKITKFRNILGNDGSKSFVVPMIHGTTEDAAWKISKNGFGTVANLADGYYGKGMYLTSDFQYASRFPRQSEQKVFLVSLAIPGNPYPMTEPPFLPSGGENPEGFFGKACKSGYQSHYILVNKEHEGRGPAEEGTNQKTIADDLIIFHESQAIPLFIVYVN